MKNPDTAEPTTDPCRYCDAEVGARHGDGCDIARCVHTGAQLLSCEAFADDLVVLDMTGAPLDVPGHGHTCSPTRWTGLWPGVAECEEFGWFSYFGPDANPPQRGWVPCVRVHPLAVHDLNRLAYDADWSPQLERWVRR